LFTRGILILIDTLSLAIATEAEIADARAPVVDLVSALKNQFAVIMPDSNAICFQK
jgi:hypothetical protein